MFDTVMQLDHGAQMDLEQRDLERGIYFALTQGGMDRATPSATGEAAWMNY